MHPIMYWHRRTRVLARYTKPLVAPANWYRVLKSNKGSKSDDKRFPPPIPRTSFQFWRSRMSSVSFRHLSTA